ncbi:hypothetical protein PHYC_02950 [Phycisphaerales bacterium]|nr:hypothetical protein PHYC_02950 [Phycisphaerales bacterium]
MRTYFTAIVLIVAAFTSAARAQDTLTRDFGPGSWLVGGDDIRAMTDILKLRPDQSAAVRELLRGFRAEYQVLERKYSRAMAPFEDRLWEQTPRGEDARKRTSDIMDRYADDVEKIEKQFFSDAMSLVDAEQQAQWTSFERARRRLLINWMGGEVATVDLCKLIRRMDLTDEERDTVRPLLERYEQELDALILERRGLVRPTKPWTHRYYQDDSEQSPDDQKKMADLLSRFANVQRTHAQILAGRLGAERGAEIMGAVEATRSWFGSLLDDYRLRELTRLKGVSDEQKARLRRIMTRGDAEFRRSSQEFFDLAAKQQRGEAIDEAVFQKQYADLQAKFSEVRERSLKDALQVLTPEQRKGYEDGTDEAKEDVDEDMRGQDWWW